ncbi:BrnT family toxin, partial [Candidatus Poribacteria bacterium]|nr:BrnT family toxin [Candidatus Poribacteria bacterium]
MEFYDNFKFDWDENKQRNNVRKHKVSFYEAITVFSSSPLLTENDDLHSQYEQRYKTTGYSVKNRLLVVIYTDRGDVTRIISARKANKLERENYHEHFSEYLPP